MQAEEWTFNTHEARFEPPDTVWITFRGRTELEDVRWAADLFRQLAANGPIFIASDVRDSTLTTEARDFIAREGMPELVRAALYIGSPFPQKAMGKAINLTAILMGKPTVEMVFVDDADQAREWIEKARARRPRGRSAR